MNEDIFNLIDRIGEQENIITEKVIISPVFYNTRITTRIEHIVYFFDIPPIEPGWYKFKPIDNKKAEIIGQAELDEIQHYFKFLPRIRLILTFRKQKIYFGVPMKSNHFSFDISNLLPIYLFDDTATDFIKCICRYDGANLWYESIDFSNDIAKTDYLEESLKKLRDPKRIRYIGLTLEEKIAYNIKFKVDKKTIEESKKTKIQRDVEFAGGKFIESKERSDHIFVTYEVDGQKFSTIISKNSGHQIITAGICLTDHATGRAGDSDYDLKSLISVIREGQKTYQISRTL